MSTYNVDSMLERVKEITSDEFLEQSKIPEHLRGGICRYLRSGIMPGDFLKGVIENQLDTAVLNADPVSLASIQDVVTYFWRHVPYLIYGNPERVDAWIKAHRGRLALGEPE